MSKKVICPLLKKPCIEHECAWYCHIEGINPQTGAAMDLWDCSIKWTPIMMIDAARQTRNVQAAVETMRNDVVGEQSKVTRIFETAALVQQSAKRLEG